MSISISGSTVNPRPGGLADGMSACGLSVDYRVSFEAEGGRSRTSPQNRTDEYRAPVDCPVAIGCGGSLT